VAVEDAALEVAEEDFELLDLVEVVIVVAAVPLVIEEEEPVTVDMETLVSVMVETLVDTEAVEETAVVMLAELGERVPVADETKVNLSE